MLQRSGLTAFCLSGIEEPKAGTLPEGGIDRVVVANVLTLTDGTLRTTFKRDISATVDICCGVEDKGGDVVVAAFTKAGEKLLRSDGGGEAGASWADERLELALSIARAERKANGGRFPSARVLQRAIRRTAGDGVKVRRAKRLSGVKLVDAVYIVGKPRGGKLRLATRTDSGHRRRAQDFR